MGSIRQLDFPRELSLFQDLLTRGYAHPEHPEWDDPAELESLSDKVTSVRRIWPVLGPFFPNADRMFAALAWEEDGVPVGAISVLNRTGSSPAWIIASALVLPEYRGRGIGQKLSMAAINQLREWGACYALATVIAENTPVIRISEAAGAVRYSSYSALIYDPQTAPPACEASPGYTLERVRDRRTLFELERQLVPQTVQIFEPVQLADFKPNPLIRVGIGLSVRLSGHHEYERLIVHRGEPVGYIWVKQRVRPGGLHRLTIRLQREHAHAAAGLLADTVCALDTTHKVAMDLPHWTELLPAARQAGFVHRTDFLHYGLEFPSC